MDSRYGSLRERSGAEGRSDKTTKKIVMSLARALRPDLTHTLHANGRGERASGRAGELWSGGGGEVGMEEEEEAEREGRRGSLVSEDRV